MAQIHQTIRQVFNRCPILRKISSVGWKVVLTETLIEIPFLILESSALMRLLFGFTLGLTLWQYIGVATSLYLLIEAGRWLFIRHVRKSKNYRVFDHEREVVQMLWLGFVQLRRKLAGSKPPKPAHPCKEIKP